MIAEPVLVQAFKLHLDQERGAYLRFFRSVMGIVAGGAFGAWLLIGWISWRRPRGVTARGACQGGGEAA